MIVSVGQSQSYATFPINPCTQASRWSVDQFDNLPYNIKKNRIHLFVENRQWVTLTFDLAFRSAIR